MSTGLVGAVKQAALDAIENAQMCDLRYGEVVSTSPLKVKVTNQFTLPSSLLIVPEHLTNHTVSVSLNWTTESTSGGSEDTLFASHDHKLSGTKTMTIYNALQTGDKVALLRKQGGQSYFILDRI